MGINTQQNDYFENLFKRTTASYRAKIDKENCTRNQTKRKSNDNEMPTTSKQAADARREFKDHGIVNYKSSYSNISSDSREYNILQQSHHNKYNGKTKEKQTSLNPLDSVAIKSIIEATLTQVLQEKFPQKGCNEKEQIITSPKSLKYIVEDTLDLIQQQRRSDLQKYAGINPSDQGSFKTIIEDIVAQVLKEKLSVCPKDVVDNLNRDLQEKLDLSKERSENSVRESRISQNIVNKSLNSQAFVEKLLGSENPKKDNKPMKHYNSNVDKENCSTSAAAIKRLRRSPRKQPEWQDPGRLDGILEKQKFTKNQKSVCSHSPATAVSSIRSGRSRPSSSVMIPRSTSQGRNLKPNSDPVALYQYYKKEWQHFREQIPGETMHNRLRWHVRQRMLDPE